MIYISSSCVNYSYINESIEFLINKGIRNIELSGGTKNYVNLLNDLLKLKKNHKIKYICHNYFPPPEEDFFVNLASLNDEIYEKSILHIKKSIEFCNKLESEKFGFHAGFYIDPIIDSQKHSFKKTKFIDKKRSNDRFINAYNEIESFNKNYGIKLYIENNINSKSNNEILGENIFMLTTFKEYTELIKKKNFNLLLDVGHLKVSCNTLSIDYLNELSKFIEITDYIHVSDNNGFEDSNNELTEESAILKFKNLLKNKIVTLEIYKPFENIIKSIELLDN